MSTHVCWVFKRVLEQQKNLKISTTNLSVKWCSTLLVTLGLWICSHTSCGMITGNKHWVLYTFSKTLWGVYNCLHLTDRKWRFRKIEHICLGFEPKWSYLTLTLHIIIFDLWNGNHSVYSIVFAWLLCILNHTVVMRAL